MAIRNDAHRDEFHRDQQWHKPVRVATTANITISTALNNGDTLDGITLATGDRVLVKDQSTGSQNGIYIVGASPARAYDMLVGIQAMGAFVFVRSGTANGQKLFYNTNTTLPTIDSTTLSFTEFSAGSSPASSDGAFTVETQNMQSRRYLMQDGTFRDPLVSGLGTVSAGSPSTITDDSKYNAWPNICRLTENRVMLAYTKADSHHGDNTGKAVIRIGAESDGALTWGSEITAYDHASLWSSQIGVQRISTGRIFMTLWRDNFSSSGTGEAGIVYSDDDGATWSAWIDLTNGFTQESYGAGAVCEMPDGDLLVTIEGSNSGQAIANRSSHTLRSTDEGLTWGGEVTVRNYVTDSRPYYESSLILLDDDTLQCYHRTAASSPGTHYISTSTDFGFTWSAPVAIVSGYGKPNVIQAASGTLFLVTRQNATADTILFTSIDRGTTWDSGTVIATVTEMMYGAPVESLTAGDVYVVWGDEVSSSNDDIDIATVTEDVTTFSGVTLSDDTPLIEAGSGDPGVSDEASRSDHVHPEFGSAGGTHWEPVVDDNGGDPQVVFFDNGTHWDIVMHEVAD